MLWKGPARRKFTNRDNKLQKLTYQSPSLVIFADGNIFFKAAGTFPENDGSTSSHWRKMKTRKLVWAITLWIEEVNNRNTFNLIKTPGYEKPWSANQNSNIKKKDKIGERFLWNQKQWHTWGHAHLLHPR